jgi:cobalt-precorrin-5B (C1)-methyltransferase
MTKKTLRHGYTTGACAAAAAKGAALMLRDRTVADEATITLPGGETVTFRLHGQGIEDDSASCFVVKDAGDDPDVTNGAEIHATVRLNPPQPPFTKGGSIVIEGGAGIGRVTKPGLAVAVGEWAINPVPRRMIEEAIREVLPINHRPSTVNCLITIPNGAELAKKTLNERLGIVGGLSILGTTGIVRPVSARAWTDTIDAAIDVALACGSDTVVLSTGRTSEMVAQKYLSKPATEILPSPLVGEGQGGGDAADVDSTLPLAPSHQGRGESLPDEAFVMMGDHVGHALHACARKGVRRLVIAGQFAKLVKIACGHEQTHVASSELDLESLAAWVSLSPRTSHLAPLVRAANTARELLETSGRDPALIALVCGRVGEFARQLAPGVQTKVLLAGYGGDMLYIG